MNESTSVAEYNPIAAGLAIVRQRYANVAWDLKTTKGNADARAAEQAKIDAEHKRIANELAQQQAKIDAQRAEIERAAREQQEREQAAVQTQAEKDAAAKKAAADPARPTDVQIVELLAGHYRAHPVEVIGWLRGIDFAALAPDLLSLAA